MKFLIIIGTILFLANSLSVNAGYHGLDGLKAELEKAKNCGCDCKKPKKRELGKTIKVSK